MLSQRVQVEHLVSKYKYESDYWMHDVNDPVRVWRPEVVGEYRRGKKRAQLHAFFIVAVLEAAKELHVAGELEQNAAELPSVRDHSKADKRLISARGRFHEAVSRLLELEAPKKKKAREMHYAGGIYAGVRGEYYVYGDGPACDKQDGEAIKEGSVTWHTQLVTCKRCLRRLTKAGMLEGDDS